MLYNTKAHRLTRALPAATDAFSTARYDALWPADRRRSFFRRVNRMLSRDRHCPHCHDARPTDYRFYPTRRDVRGRVFRPIRHLVNGGGTRLRVDKRKSVGTGDAVILRCRRPRPRPTEMHGSRKRCFIRNDKRAYVSDVRWRVKTNEKPCFLKRQLRTTGKSAANVVFTLFRKHATR